MNNILSAEFFRLKKSKLFWAMFGVCAGLPLVSIVLEILVMLILAPMNGGTITLSELWAEMRTANLTGQMLSEVPATTSDCMILAVICSSVFVSREFSFGTYRNMLLANRSRAEIYFSYLLMALTVGASYMTANMATMILFSGAMFGFGTVSALTAFTEIVTAFTMGLVAVLFVQTMMCMFLFVTRKLAVALSCPLVICIFLPSIILGIVSFASILSSIGGNSLAVGWEDWIPIYNSSTLDLSAAVDGAHVGKILMYELPLTTLFVGMGWVGFRNADLK